MSGIYVLGKPPCEREWYLRIRKEFLTEVHKETGHMGANVMSHAPGKSALLGKGSVQDSKKYSGMGNICMDMAGPMQRSTRIIIFFVIVDVHTGSTTVSPMAILLGTLRDLEI